MRRTSALHEAHTETDPGGSAPKVSVACITYDHEAFIGDALDGILMQNVDFPIEIVIGEDCSRDATRAIVERYQREHPGLIRLSNHEQNLGSGRNVEATLARCRGEYVAYLDGDDYWTSPDKLKKQVAFMDTHPDFSMCFHPTLHIWNDGRAPPMMVYPPGRKAVYGLADVANWCNMHPCSIMYRRSALPELPPWYFDCDNGDWALTVILAAKGNIGYLPDAMATYRQHAGGIWAGRVGSQSDIFRSYLRHVDLYRGHVGKEREAPFVRSKAAFNYRLAHACLDEGDRAGASAALAASGYRVGAARLEPFLALLHLRSPRLYAAMIGAWQTAWSLARRTRTQLFRRQPAQ